MKGLAGLVLSLCDLAEAEGRLLRDNIRRVGTGCALSFIAILFIGAALAFLVAAIYAAIANYTSGPLAWLIMCGVCFLISLLVFWSSSLCAKKSPKKAPKKKPK